MPGCARHLRHRPAVMAPASASRNLGGVPSCLLYRGYGGGSPYAGVPRISVNLFAGPITMRVQPARMSFPITAS